MAVRSVVVTFVNLTSHALSRQDFGLSIGIWSTGPNGQMVPPEQVPPNGNAIFGSESDGFATGTQGFANYEIGGDSSQIVSLQWDNPFIGDNSYPSTCPSNYSLQTFGGSGDNAAVAIILTGP
jgi:aegerolysin